MCVWARFPIESFAKQQRSFVLRLNERKLSINFSEIHIFRTQGEFCFGISGKFEWNLWLKLTHYGVGSLFNNDMVLDSVFQRFLFIPGTLNSSLIIL